MWRFLRRDREPPLSYCLLLQSLSIAYYQWYGIKSDQSRRTLWTTFPGTPFAGTPFQTRTPGKSVLGDGMHHAGRSWPPVRQPSFRPPPHECGIPSTSFLCGNRGVCHHVPAPLRKTELALVAQSNWHRVDFPHADRLAGLCALGTLKRKTLQFIHFYRYLCIFNEKF